MPRRIVAKVSAERRIKSADRRWSRNLGWVDPFPEVHGTLPEKMVYAELSWRGIPFLFLNDMRFKILEISFDKWYQADFVIPSAKIIIEVQGAYWHSMPKTVEADAYKFVIYETLGYKVIAWWDYDIISRLHDLFFAEPALMALSKSVAAGRKTELPVQRRTKVDSSKGIRTLNQRRKVQKAPRQSIRRLKSVRSSYATR